MNFASEVRPSVQYPIILSPGCHAFIQYRILYVFISPQKLLSANGSPACLDLHMIPSKAVLSKY